MRWKAGRREGYEDERKDGGWRLISDEDDRQSGEED